MNLGLDEALRREGFLCAHGLTACEGCRLHRPIGFQRGVAPAAPVLAKTLTFPTYPTIRSGR